MTPLRVMGIDPGLANVGWGVIDWPGRGRATLVDYGVIQTPAGDPLAARLGHIFQEVRVLTERFSPAAVAIEQIYFAKNVKTAMVVAHARAAAILGASQGGVDDVLDYTPLQIKQALTGHGRAPKQQVQMMVRAVLGLDAPPRPDHAADALAAALCHVHSLGFAEKAKQTDPVTPDETDPRKLLLASRRRRRRRR